MKFEIVGSSLFSLVHRVESADPALPNWKQLQFTRLFAKPHPAEGPHLIPAQKAKAEIGEIAFRIKSRAGDVLGIIIDLSREKSPQEITAIRETIRSLVHNFQVSLSRIFITVDASDIRREDIEKQIFEVLLEHPDLVVLVSSVQLGAHMPQKIEQILDQAVNDRKRASDEKDPFRINKQNVLNHMTRDFLNIEYIMKTFLTRYRIGEGTSELDEIYRKIEPLLNRLNASRILFLERDEVVYTAMESIKDCLMALIKLISPLYDFFEGQGGGENPVLRLPHGTRNTLFNASWSITSDHGIPNAVQGFVSFRVMVSEFYEKSFFRERFPIIRSKKQ